MLWFIGKSRLIVRNREGTHFPRNVALNKPEKDESNS